jgi:predicted metalloprotease with PDZ domain
MKKTIVLSFVLLGLTLWIHAAEWSGIRFVVSMSDPDNHRFQLEMQVPVLTNDTVLLRMPQWTPGYYQLMDYASDLLNMHVTDNQGAALVCQKADGNTWKVVAGKKPFRVRYEVNASQSFVARSLLDSTHAYLIPANMCLYPVGQLNRSVRIELKPSKRWNQTVTGLVRISDNVYQAPDYDILYDCPILIGNLTELPAFDLNGIRHRFVGYDLGQFDGETMMRNIRKFIVEATKMIGDIPYDSYTFIGIGSGRGGIEHLNNTTVSFQGDRLRSEADINDIILYLGHEYFHNFNVKRIRPFELGPFDYNRPNRTNQLWISEGLTMYYEYVLAKRAGLMDEKGVLACFENHIRSVQNNPARLVQSMVQSSYGTWEDGPFTKPGQTISYYEKGPVVGLVMDLAIRKATSNEKSLDDVMRYVYETYYKELKRGFTEAEFQQACERIAGVSMTKEFEYVTTTKEFDYSGYLNSFGLELTGSGENLQLKRMAEMDANQQSALKKWLSE